MTPCVGVRVSRWWEILTWCHTTTTTPPHLHTFAISHPPWPNLTRSKVLFIYCTINLERLTMVSFPCVVILIFSVLVTHWDTLSFNYWETKTFNLCLAVLFRHVVTVVLVTHFYNCKYFIFNYKIYMKLSLSPYNSPLVFLFKSSLWNYKVRLAKSHVELWNWRWWRWQIVIVCWQPLQKL